jgi:CHAT domain-containing protein
MDASPRQRAEAAIHSASGRLRRLVAPRGAIRALSKALAFYRRAANRFLSTPLYLLRAQTYAAIGDAAAEERDLASGIDEYERQREQVAGEALRISFFDQTRELYDAMIRLQALGKGRYDRALDYVERARARSLLDRLGALPSARRAERDRRPLGAEEIRRAVPPGEVLVEYAVLDDVLLAWSIRGSGIVPVRVKVGRDELARRVGELRRAIAAGTSGRAADPLSRLYDLLVRPLPTLAPGESVVFVPDGSLHSVPFAALRDRASGRYLVEEHAVGVAPSATAFAHCLRRDGAIDRAAEPDALIVSQPTFDRTLFSQLADLPGTAREAEGVARLYPRHEILGGPAATKAAVLAALGRHAVIELAGHSLVNPEFPLLSRLALAPGAGDSGSLYAHELYGLRLPRTRLVVLSSCSSGAGDPTPSEGVLSLARPFLAAGVPAVVASLWEVEDEPTARLLTAFHRHLRGGESALAALRSAQRELLADPDPALRSPAYWAAFELFGGGLPG